MRIILVDDSEGRRKSLANFLVENRIVSEEEIAHADCIDAAKKLMRFQYFDVLILDVVLPKRRSESADPKNGLDMLGQLSRSTTYQKPEKIIGITAHVNDIGRFRIEFDKYCVAVVEANDVTVGWKTAVMNSIMYTSASKASRAVASNNIEVLTIHGICTFGDWQIRLEQLTRERIGKIYFHSYRYGYFPVLDFLIPQVRAYEARRLSHHMLELFESSPGKRFLVFSHSFGTYLLAQALLKLVGEGREIPIDSIVLSGSVLNEDWDWGFIRRKGVRIVNDCADKDYILYLSKIFVLGTGMAGKTGFYGFQDGMTLNRFFNGGHSSYFEGDEFMAKYWLPLFEIGSPPGVVDLRSPSTLRHGIFEHVIKLLSKVKPYAYLALFLTAGAKILSFWI
ncbi:hypothetical protein [Massilia sp. PWRC2]|uniref:hypothetical protein n=1 Tax=Massilia sp. PWRC2 TaxID=2804626 RepID=UPI003CF0E1B5